MNCLLPGYQLLAGTGIERALLLKFLSQSYQELFPAIDDVSHLVTTVERYFSAQTPLWWVVKERDATPEAVTQYQRKIACLWMGNAIDQVWGDRYAHIFLLYVVPEYRRQGIGRALLGHAHAWAASRGDRQIGLQVFAGNQAALNLYRQLGYQTQSLLMIKKLEEL